MFIVGINLVLAYAGYILMLFGAFIIIPIVILTVPFVSLFKLLYKLLVVFYRFVHGV